MRQGETESLRAFLKRLNHVLLEVPTTTLEVIINALTNGLRDGDLFSSLAKKHVATLNDLLRRAEKCITLEEVRKAKKIESKPSSSEKEKFPEVKSPDPEPIWGIFHRKFEKYTPLKLHPAEVLQVAVDHPEITKIIRKFNHYTSKLVLLT
ncbi:hypothetical protein ACS0TY_013301 [Phlomoides rotata]